MSIEGRTGPGTDREARGIAFRPIAVLVRSLWTAAIPAMAGIGSLINPALAVTLILWAVVVLVVNWVWFRRGLWRARLATVLGIEIVLAAALIALSGGLLSLLWSVLLVPGITATSALGRRAGGWTALASAVVGGVAAFLGNPHVPGGAAAIRLTSLAVLLASLMLNKVVRWVEDRVPYDGTPSWAATERDAARRMAEVLRSVADLSGQADPGAILDRALDVCARALRAESAGNRLVSAVLLPGASGLQVAAARRLSLADRRAVLNPETGILAEVLRGPARLAVRKPRIPDDVDQLESLQDCDSAVAIPLNTPQGRGVLVFGHPRAAFFDDDRAAVLQAVGLQLEVVLRTALRCRDLAAEKERLTDLEEEARKRMARDLHDGPTQVLASIAMRANYARRLMQRDRKAAAEELEQLEDMARQTTKDIRQMLFTLRPLILESHGLAAALAQLADKMHDTYDVNVIVEAAPEAADGVDPALQGVAFYVAEEALNNARKHAAAAHIWIRLDRRGSVLILEVRDDGVGFNVGAVDATYAQRGSLGMVNMRERAELVGGSLRVESAEGRGTLVTLTLPVRPAPELHAVGRASSTPR
ncbi:MAG: GAF domain-containing sensor histidine kinase [Chloroflexi bacterium]|nr:GAF domain-containing sensor histidine kinase [Chloroflexota bacterium]